ncbi:MAG: type II secretion system F family protein [Chloroflexi bacterium]|nr:type II secretion system F family protein [Chloroflexota bacterium]
MTQSVAAQPPARPADSRPAPAVLPKRKYFFGLIDSSDKISRRELVSFTRELSTLLEAGVPLVPALKLLTEQRKNKALGAVIEVMLGDLASGTSLASAMARHPKVFGNVYVRTVGTSEHGAPIVAALNHAAEFLESAESALAQLKKALIYPSIVLLLGLGVSYMMLTVTLPPMIGLFSSLDTGLPLPTRILIAVSGFLQAYKLYVIIALLAVVFGLYRYGRTPRGRYRIHTWILKIPVISNIVLQNDIARSAGAMSALTSAGLPLAEAMEVAIDTASNEVVKQALRQARVRLIAGEGLAVPLAETGIFPATFTQALRVAEDTGTLDANLRRVAEFYKKDASEAVRTFGSLLEPLSTVTISLLVGFMALAVIMPMYSVLTALSK